MLTNIKDNSNRKYAPCSLSHQKIIGIILTVKTLNLKLQILILVIFYEFFKDLNKTDDEHETDKANHDFPAINIDHEINKEITCDELDELFNEYIKHSCGVLLPVYHHLFNSGLNTGYIIPIYKNKGNAESPENDRPITMLSCMGKLFTARMTVR